MKKLLFLLIPFSVFAMNEEDDEIAQHMKKMKPPTDSTLYTIVKENNTYESSVSSYYSIYETNSEEQFILKNRLNEKHSFYSEKAHPNPEDNKLDIEFNVAQEQGFWKSILHFSESDDSITLERKKINIITTESVLMSKKSVAILYHINQENTPKPAKR